MFALVDCNNFYASCERLFRPDLHGKPIIVLSNNDGCVIARSNEARAIGIQMGAPFYQMKALIEQYKVTTFSSNYTLYGDLSQRVMSVIEDTWPEVEIYSIDEAFLDLSSLPKSQRDPFCVELQKKIWRYVGIPVSIGIGPSKTLAKLANYIAKKKLNIPVFNISHQYHWLSLIKIEEVWGIGRQWAKKLQSQGIYTAADLTKLELPFIRQHYNVVLMRTAMELQGIACVKLQTVEPKQSILSSKSFGQMQTEFSALAQAISSHCARACKKARQQNLVAHQVHVFIRSNSFRKDLTQYAQSTQHYLINPTNDTREITTAAKLGLKKLFKPGISYKKVGIMLIDLVPQKFRQIDMFAPISEETLKHSEQLMKVFDTINARFGNHTIRLAAEGYQHHWKMRADMCSPCYTTRWPELPLVK